MILTGTPPRGLTSYITRIFASLYKREADEIQV